MSILLVAVNAGLYFANRSGQDQANLRAQYIRQGQTIESLYQEIVKALANLAIERHDEEIKALLAQEGFTISPTPANTAIPDARSKP